MAGGVACTPQVLPASCPAVGEGAPAGSGAPAASAAGSAGAAEKAPPELMLTLVTEFAVQPGVRGTIVARGESGAARSWRLEKGRRAGLIELSVEDQKGRVDHEVKEATGGLDIQMSREIIGPLTIRYLLTLPESADEELGSQVDPNRSAFQGESALFLPVTRMDELIDLSLQVRGLASDSDGVASTLGLGREQRGRHKPRELRGSAFLMSADLGTARFRSYEGHDEASWSGFTQFDPRWIAAEVATTRSSVDQYLGGRDMPPFAMLLVSEKRPEAPFSLLPRVGGVFLRVDQNSPWGVSIRIRLATELARRWLGRRIHFTGSSREAFWFSEGFSRAIGRDVLFASGSMTPAEFGDDANLLLATEQLSPLRHQKESTERDLADPKLAAFFLAKGALQATRLDLLIRERSKRQRSLRELVRGLLKISEERPDHSLTMSDILGEIREAAGEEESRLVREVIDRGADVPLLPRMLGNCFRQEKMKFEPFELGFTEKNRTVAAVLPGSAAARAGLLAGDQLTGSDFQEGRPRSPVKLSVQRASGPLVIRYFPAGKPVPGQGYTRDKSIADDNCAR